MSINQKISVEPGDIKVSVKFIFHLLGEKKRIKMLIYLLFILKKWQNSSIKVVKGDLNNDK